MKKSWTMAFALALAPAWSPSLSAAPPISGTVSIEPVPAEPNIASAMPLFVNAVGDALTARGFTLLDQPGHAAFVVEVDVSRADVGTGAAKVPTSGAQVIPGGASPAVGAGVIIPLPTGKSTLVPLQRTRLDIRVRKLGENDVAWHGAAVTVRAARTAKGTDKAVAADLAQAILRAYPSQPEDVIGVP